MEIRVLRYFLAIAREQNISKAAEYLHVTQPTLSRQIMELEEELHTTLFTRGNRKITLTTQGMMFKKRAQEIIALVDKTEADFQYPFDDISGDIYIGSGETDAMRLFAKVSKTILEEYPNIRFHLFSGNAEDVTERLDKGLLDFGILIEPVDLQKYDFIRLPIKDHWGILMRKDDPLAAFDEIKPEQLWNRPLITSRQHQVPNELSAWLGKRFSELNIVTTYNLIFNASIMVEEGVGIAFTLDKLINTDGDCNLCFRPLQPSMDASLVIVWKKYQIFSKPSELFLRRVKEHL